MPKKHPCLRGIPVKAAAKAASQNFHWSDMVHVAALAKVTGYNVIMQLPDI